MGLTTPVIQDNHFSGQSAITKGTSNDGINDLATLLQAMRADLLKTDIDASGSGIVSAPVQIIEFLIAGGATLITNLTIPAGIDIRVFDVQTINRGLGTAGDTVLVGKAAAAICDAIDINVADKVIARAATIDDANYDLTAADVLRVTLTDGGGTDVPPVRVAVFVQAL